MTNYAGTNYAGWSAQKLKDAAKGVNPDPLQRVADLLAYGEARAAEINLGLQEAIQFLTGGWSGRAASNAHARTTLTAQGADTSASNALVANSNADLFAKAMVQAKADVSALPADAPPNAAAYLFPGALLGPVGVAGANAAYLYKAQQAEAQRQALVAKITAMDSQGQTAVVALTNSFGQGLSDVPPPPPAKLPAAPGGGTSTAGTGPARTTAPAARGTAPSGPRTTVPGSTGRTVPGQSNTPVPGPATGSTVPGGSPTIPVPTAAGTVPQSFTVPTAAGAVTSPTTGLVPGGAVLPGTASPTAGAGGLGGTLLGGALATGGASAALGSSSVGLPGTVSGGWTPGGTAGTPRGLAAEPTGSPGMSSVPPGAMRPGPGSTGQSPRRTVGRGGVARSGTGEPGGSRPGVLSPGQGAGAGGRAGRTALGRNVGSRGAAGTRRRRDADNELAGRPDYLVESDDVWGDGRTVVRGVLGQRPETSEGTDTW